MDNPWSEIRQLISKEIKKETGLDIINLLEEPVLEYGDLALPCFTLAKEMKMNPNLIAQNLSKKLKIKYITKIDAAGPYINFYIDWKTFGKDVLKSVNKKYGQNKSGKKKRVMVEFSQANTNKPLHIGHARNNVLGDSLSNILLHNNYSVIKTNYAGDMGLHIAKTIYAYNEWSNAKKLNEKPDHFIGGLYTMFSKKMEEDPTIEDKARTILKLWEQGDKKTIETWKKLRKWAIDGQNETYKRFGINFNKTLYESDFEESGKKYIPELLKKGLAFKGETGEIVADMEKFGIPGFILLRSDGTSLYQTKELSLIETKFKKYKLDRAINVVGMEQELYFRQVFKLLELLGSKTAGKSYHLAYGLVMLPEGGKMSGREEGAVLLDDLIDDIQKIIQDMIKDRVNKKKSEQISEKVAIAAIKYALVKVSPERSVIFNKNEITKYEGDTGPYLQYSHARANSILKKVKTKSKSFSINEINKQEAAVLKQIAKYPDIIERAAKEYRPHILANYLFNLCENFNNFYQNVPVLKSEKMNKDFRLKLVDSFITVLADGLKLLGIEPLKEM